MLARYASHAEESHKNGRKAPDREVVKDNGHSVQKLYKKIIQKLSENWGRERILELVAAGSVGAGQPTTRAGLARECKAAGVRHGLATELETLSRTK